MSMLATEKLNSKEQEEYGKCKWKIQEHRKTWRLFAEAMKAVRDGRLYRQEFATFDDFCDAHSPYSRRWVDTVIEAYQVFLSLGTRVPENLLPSVDSVKHWLALKDVPGDRLAAVFKRIEKDRNGKPVTTSMIEKAVHGPKPQRPAEVPSKPNDVELEDSGIVEGSVLSRETVTSTVKQSNDRPVAITDGASDVVRAVDPVAVPSRPVEQTPEKTAISLGVSVESVVRAALTKADGLEILEELIRQLIADGNEYSVAEICRKHAGASEEETPVSFEALVELAAENPELPVREIYGSASEYGKRAIFNTVNSLHGVRLLPEDPAQAAWAAFAEVADDSKQVFVETIAELWKTHSGKKNLKVNTFVKPTLAEVKKYCEERQSKVDPEEFYDHYQASGWKLTTGVQLKDWQAAVRKWERDPRRKSSSPSIPVARGPLQRPKFEPDSDPQPVARIDAAGPPIGKPHAPAICKDLEMTEEEMESARRALMEEMMKATPEGSEAADEG